VNLTDDSDSLHLPSLDIDDDISIQDCEVHDVDVCPGKIFNHDHEARVWEVEVESEVELITVILTQPTGSHAIITNKRFQKQSPPLTVFQGPNLFPVSVVAADGVTTCTYTVIVHRKFTLDSGKGAHIHSELTLLRAIALPKDETCAPFVGQSQLDCGEVWVSSSHTTYSLSLLLSRLQISVSHTEIFLFFCFFVLFFVVGFIV
jgi:hypothetical protein